jgi:hypothetical protein
MISRQRVQVTGAVARDKAVERLKRIGARNIKVRVRKPTKRQLRSRPDLPTKYCISYAPAVTSVSNKSIRTKSGPWLKPTPFYAQSKRIYTPGVRV